MSNTELLKLAITNHLTVQELKDLVVNNKELTENDLTELLNQYTDYLTSYTNELDNNLNINL